jgi:hypothetical protein
MFPVRIILTVWHTGILAIHLSQVQNISIPDDEPRFKKAAAGMQSLINFQEWYQRHQCPPPMAGTLTVTDLEAIARIDSDASISSADAFAINRYLLFTWQRQCILDRQLAVNAALLFSATLIFHFYHMEFISFLTETL